MNLECKRERNRKRDIEEVFPPFSKEDAYTIETCLIIIFMSTLSFARKSGPFKKNSIINQESQEEMKRPNYLTNAKATDLI